MAITNQALKQQLAAEIEILLPNDGGDCGFMMPNAPTILLSRDQKLQNHLVPVYFIAGFKDEEERHRVLAEIYPGSNEAAKMRHIMVSNKIGEIMVVPFLYFLDPSARQFCHNVEMFMASMAFPAQLVWQLEHCFLYANYDGAEYEPSEEWKSLCR